MSYITPRLNVTKMLSYKIIAIKIKKKDCIYTSLFDPCEDGPDFLKGYTDDASLQIQYKADLFYIPKLLESSTFKPKSIVLENVSIRDEDLKNKSLLELIERGPDVLNLNANNIGNKGCETLARLIEQGLFSSLCIAAQYGAGLSIDGLLTIVDSISTAFQKKTLQGSFELETDLFLTTDNDVFWDTLKLGLPKNIKVNRKEEMSCFFVFTKVTVQ